MKSKKNIKSIVILALLSILALFFINTSFAVNTAKVNVETANLREKADTTSKILMLLPINQEVEILAKEQNWYKVKVSGITGYLREDIITLNGANEETPQNNNTKPEKTQEQTQTESPKTEESKNTNKKKVKENTKLKIIPVINATDIMEVKQGEEVTTTEKMNGWVYVEVGLTKGWIREEKLTEIEELAETEKPEEKEQPKEEPETQEVVKTEKRLKTLYVNTELVNVRKEASTSSEVIARLALNTAVDVYAEENGWYKVKVIGKEGYISASLLSETKKEVTSTSSRGTETMRTSSSNLSTSTPSAIGQTVVETAKNYIGSKYAYGGASPSGFDCSGFTSYVYKQHGVTLNRTAAGQYSNGTEVARADLQPGDLIMFGPSASGINHVGIYIGGGQIVHSANQSRGVTIDTIESGYYNNTYVGARRVN